MWVVTGKEAPYAFATSFLNEKKTSNQVLDLTCAENELIHY